MVGRVTLAGFFVFVFRFSSLFLSFFDVPLFAFLHPFFSSSLSPPSLSPLSSLPQMEGAAGPHQPSSSACPGTGIAYDYSYPAPGPLCLLRCLLRAFFSRPRPLWQSRLNWLMLRAAQGGGLAGASEGPACQLRPLLTLGGFFSFCLFGGGKRKGTGTEKKGEDSGMLARGL